ncbi:unnamed protein product [Malus baccata var. baccata]
MYLYIFRNTTDKKKEKRPAVKDSPTTHLKKEMAVADSLAQLHLEEKNTSSAFYKEDKIPNFIVEPRIVSKMPSRCPICTKFGHAPEQCPWRRRLGVTQVGKGYEIYGWPVHILWCSFCDEIGHHWTSECPKPDKKIETIYKSLAEQGSGHGKNPIPAQPTKLQGEIRSPFGICPICTKFGHAPEQCPWRRRLPFSVTQVGKGYEIYRRSVNILWCSFCDEIGDHRISECAEWNKKKGETDSWEEFFPEDKESQGLPTF